MEMQRAEPALAPGGLQRLGFSFEGVFRNHMVIKGRNRDSAWFSVISDEWPALAEAYRVWLAPTNFDAEGAAARTAFGPHPAGPRQW